MSLIPEVIFQTAIVRGIQKMKSDSRFIDQLFKNLSEGDREQMREFIRSKQIDLSMNFPRSPLSLPAIVILLRNENESTAFLGDSMGIQTAREFQYEGSIEDELLGGVASTSTTSGLGELVAGPQRVVSSTNNVLTVSSNSFYANQLVASDPYLVHIVDGVGKGQIRTIVGNGASNIMVSPNWTIIPDSTSVFEVRKPAVEVVGSAPALYNSRDPMTINERKGSLYTTKYQIQVMSYSQEGTIYLYSILKAIFTLSRLFMEQQGVINFKMSGTDFTNRPEYLPDQSYMRVMNIEFEHPFDIYEPFDPIINEFTVALCDGLTRTDLQVSGATISIGAQPPTVTE